MSMTIEVKNTFKSISVESQFCNLGRLSIISGKNGTGKSQLFQGIKNGTVLLSVDGENDLMQEEILHETIWSMNQKTIGPSSGNSSRELAEEVSSYWRGSGDSWHFTITAGERHYRGIDIYNEIEGTSLSNSHSLYNLPLDKAKVKNWAEEQVRRSKPFQIEKLSSILINYYVKLLSAFRESQERGRELEDKAPWLKLNRILKDEAGLSFEILEPEEEDIQNPRMYIPKCKKTGTGEEFSVVDLSDGEKILLALSMSTLLSEEDNLTKIKVLLLDEVDGNLHPAMTQMLLSLLRVLAEKEEIHIILTTHSPTTVALANDDELYLMTTENNDRLKKIKRNELLSELAQGILSLSVIHQNRRHVIVESENDVKWLEVLYKLAKVQGLPPSDIELQFISSGVKGSSQSGNNVNVKSLVKGFENNSFVLGLVDRDSGVGSDRDRIVVVGGGERYAIENIVLDPKIFLGYVRSNTDLKVYDNHKHDLSSTTGPQEQVNMLVNTMRKLQPEGMGEINENDVNVEYSDGSVLRIPQWYLDIQGHQLEKWICSSFDGLKRYHNEGNLMDKIINFLNHNGESIPLPKSLIETFEKLQNGVG